jgi:hypothetical protein
VSTIPHRRLPGVEHLISALGCQTVRARNLILKLTIPLGMRHNISDPMTPWLWKVEKD